MSRAEADVVAAFRMLQQSGDPFTLRDIQALAKWSRVTVARVLRDRGLWDEKFQSQLDAQVKHLRAEGLRRHIKADPFGIGNERAQRQRGRKVGEENPRVAQGKYIRQQVIEIVRGGLAKGDFEPVHAIAARLGVKPSTLYYHIHQVVGHEISVADWKLWESGVRATAARAKPGPLVRSSVARGDEHREAIMAMVEALGPGERLRPRDIVRTMGVHHSTASEHVRALRRQGILDEKGRRVSS